jgi:preprotein translocase subunit SecA
MAAEDISETIEEVREDVIHSIVSEYIPRESLEEQWNVPGLEEALERDLTLKLDLRGWLEQDSSLHEETLRQRILEAAREAYREKEAQVGAPVMRHFEKAVMLQVLDTLWKEHLAGMDYLRQGIHLRGYAQKDPKQEYKREAFQMFSSLLDRVKQEVVGVLSRVQVRAEEDVEAVEARRRAQAPVEYSHPQSSPYPVATGVMAEAGDVPPPAEPEEAQPVREPFVREGRKIGRNEPCPCGSGKKYKNCHGKLA